MARKRKPAGVSVQRDDVDLDALGRAVVKAGKGRVGAVTTFTGFVRADKLGQGRVRSMEYEAFGEMALEQLSHIRATAVTRFGLVDCRIVHRTGNLKVGQPSVFVVCAAEHRRATSDAAAWVMDEVKRVVPVWKRERGGGSERWVGGHGRGGTRLPEARLPFG